MFKTKNNKIIFWGTPDFAVSSLQELIKAKYNIIAVVTQPDRPAGRGNKIQQSPIKQIAAKNNINILQPEKLDKIFFDKIKNLNPDLCVVVAYGLIIPNELLDIPVHGFINVHGSLLPKLRGASPLQTAILDSNDKTGITIMKMDEKMDHGPIMSQDKYIIPCGETIENLHDNMADLGAKLLINTIPEYLLGNLKPKEQDHNLATYCGKINKDLGIVDIVNNNPEITEKKIRALNPWPGVWTNYKNKRIKLLKSHIQDNQLIIDQVQPEGKKPMSWQEFLNGLK